MVEITRGECEEVLRRFLKGDEFKLVEYQVVDFHSPLQGLIGEHFTLKVEYQQRNESKSESFFIKTLSSNPLLVDLSKDLQVYEKEAFFYGVLDECETSNIDSSFAPRGLFFKPYTVILEDLSQNYKGTPKKQLLDFDHCVQCVQTLAKFHAATILYKGNLIEDNPKILEDKFRSEEDSYATRYIRCTIEGLFRLIDLIPENKVTNEEFKSKLMELLSLDSGVDGLINTILHADLWTSNFLYSYENNKPVGCKLVDFQMIKYGPVEEDLVQFLVTNTTLDFRKKHYDSLVKLYFTQLEELIRGVISLPSFEDFSNSCKDFLLAGKVHAVIDHSYTFFGDEVIVESLKTEESFQELLFGDRGKFVLESYKKNEEYRKVLTEDLIELRDLLFS